MLIGLASAARRIPPAGWAALLFAAATVAYLWSTLFGGRVLSPATFLYAVAPWQGSGRSSPGVNPVLSDIAVTFQPWLRYARDSLLRGDGFPAWNPYVLGGTTFWGNPQTALLSPFSIPVFVGGEGGLGVAAALRLFVAGFGTYGLARELRLRPVPAILAGLAFSFSVFTVVWLGYALANVWALLPCALWLAERLVRRGRPSDALLLAIALTVSLLGGYSGGQAHVMGALVLYTGLRLALSSQLPRRERMRRAGLVAAAAGLAAMVAAVVLLPAALAVPGSSGADARAGGGPVEPLEAWRTLIVPDWWGRPNGLHYGGPFGGPSNYSSRTLFPGVVALLLAAVAITGRTDWRRKLPFAVFVFIGVQAPLGLWPVHEVLSDVPPFSTITNSRLIGLLCLGVAVLAAFGLQELLDSPAARQRARLVGVVGLGAVIAAFVAVDPSLHQVRLTGHHFRTGIDVPQPAVIQLTAVAWLAIAAVSFAAAVAASRWLGRRGLAIALVAVALVELVHFAWGYQSTAPRHQVYPPTTPALKFLRAHAADERVAGLGSVLPPDTAMVWKLRDVRGYDPPAPDRRVMRLFRVVNPVQTGGDFLSIPTLSSSGRHVLDVLGARWMLTEPGVRVDPRLELIPAYSGRDGLVYRNPSAVGHAFVPVRVRTMPDETALQRIAAPDFAAQQEALVPTGAIPAGVGTVRAVEHGTARVELTANMSRGGLVVLDDVLDDGWHVRIDGRRAEPVRVNTVLRGVVAPPGFHRLTWSYRVPGLAEGLALTLLGIATGVMWAAVLLLRGWRRRRATGRG